MFLNFKTEPFSVFHLPFCTHFHNGGYILQVTFHKVQVTALQINKQAQKSLLALITIQNLFKMGVKLFGFSYQSIKYWPVALNCGMCL